MLLNTFSGSFRVQISSQYYYLMNTSIVILNSSYSEENVEYNVIIVANVPKKVVARVSFYLIKSKNTLYHQIITFINVLYPAISVSTSIEDAIG